MATTVASALVSAHLDYINSILYGTSTKQITRLQRVQNALTRVVVPNRPPGSSFLHIQKHLHWIHTNVQSLGKWSTTLPAQQLCPYALIRGLRSSASNFFNFHVQTFGWAHALFTYPLPLSGTHLLSWFALPT